MICNDEELKIMRKKSSLMDTQKMKNISLLYISFSLGCSYLYTTVFADEQWKRLGNLHVAAVCVSSIISFGLLYAKKRKAAPWMPYLFQLSDSVLPVLCDGVLASIEVYLLLKMLGRYGAVLNNFAYFFLQYVSTWMVLRLTSAGIPLQLWLQRTVSIGMVCMLFGSLICFYPFHHFGSLLMLLGVLVLRKLLVQAAPSVNPSQRVASHMVSSIVAIIISVIYNGYDSYASSTDREPSWTLSNVCIGSALAISIPAVLQREQYNQDLEFLSQDGSYFSGILGSFASSVVFAMVFGVQILHPNVLLGGVILLLGIGLHERSSYKMLRKKSSIVEEDDICPQKKHSWKLLNVIEHLMEESDSKRILIFLVFNVVFMFVEILVGYYTNSLGLISDAGHMFFDNSALFIGLVASYISRWAKDAAFTYGYGRVEVLSGFINSLLLVCIALSVLMEGCGRIMDPPKVHTDHLLLTSVAGFAVNVVGLVCFHDFSHGGGGCSHGHSHDHGHDHSHDHGPNANMYGVYLHVLADTLGSVGVIISSLLIQYFEWYVSDPICSIFISILILGSSYPLIRQTGLQLVQRVPESIQKRAENQIQKLRNLPQVLDIQSYHFWQHSAQCSVGSIKLQIQDHADEQQVLQQVLQLFEHELGIDDMTVQLEKPQRHSLHSQSSTSSSIGFHHAHSSCSNHSGHHHH